MKKKVFIQIYLCLQLFCLGITAENVAKDDVSAPMTKNEIKRFYRKLIQGEEMKSMLINPPQIKSILDKKQALTQGYDLKTIYHVINNARAFTDGEWLDTIVALSFPRMQKLISTEFGYQMVAML